MHALVRPLAAGLLLAAAAAQTPPAPAPGATATFAGRDTQAWAPRLRDDLLPAIDELAAGKADAVPVLAQLLTHHSETIAEGAARACAAMGPAAAPLLPALERELRARTGWILCWHIADAARAIGAADAAMAATLLAKIETSPVAALRQQCALAYERVQPDAVAHLLAAAARGDFAQAPFAIEALAALGERAAPPLAQHLRAHRDDATARAAIEAIGWRAVPSLEREGLTELVDSVLLYGPLRHVPWHEQFVLEQAGTLAALPRLPTIGWEHHYGHGGELNLFFAAEDPRGLRVDHIGLRANPEPHALVRSTVVPRDRAHALARQLAQLGRMRLVPKPGFTRGWIASDFFARVRVAAGTDVLLDATFGGSATDANTPQRLQPQAATAVLAEALANAAWTERAPTADERNVIDARCRTPVASQPKWFTERLEQLRTLLAAR